MHVCVCPFILPGYINIALIWFSSCIGAACGICNASGRHGPAPDVAACGALLDAFDEAGQWQWSLWLLVPWWYSSPPKCTKKSWKWDRERQTISWLIAGWSSFPPSFHFGSWVSPKLGQTRSRRFRSPQDQMLEQKLPRPDLAAITSVINACGMQIQWAPWRNYPSESLKGHGFSTEKTWKNKGSMIVFLTLLGVIPGYSRIFCLLDINYCNYILVIETILDSYWFNGNITIYIYIVIYHTSCSNTCPFKLPWAAVPRRGRFTGCAPHRRLRSVQVLQPTTRWRVRVTAACSQNWPWKLWVTWHLGSKSSENAWIVGMGLLNDVD